jgi:ELWxxDGT repeat protein
MHRRGTIELLCRWTLGVSLVTALAGVGTATELVKDINEQPYVRTTGIVMLGTVDDNVLFTAGYRIAGSTELGLWRSDGTTAGTRQVRAQGIPASFGHSRPLYSTGSRVLWLASNPPREDSSSAGHGLWVSDGTSMGTFKIGDLPELDEMDPIVVGVLPDDVVVFAIGIAHDAELWRTDGTAAGTWRFAVFTALGGDHPRATLGRGARLANLLYFAARTNAHGLELWVTDGSNSPEGTRLVADLTAGVQSSNPTEFVTAGGALYFTAETAGIRRLWQLDTAEQLQQLTTGPEHAFLACASRDLVYFTKRVQPFGVASPLWRTDGTAAGTFALTTQPTSTVTKCTAVGDQVYFSAFDGDLLRLWRSDGIVPGTVPTSFREGSSGMTVLLATDTHLLVTTLDVGAQGHQRLWATDGAGDSREIITGVPIGDSQRIAAASVGPHIVFVVSSVPPPPPTPFLPPAELTLQIWRADAGGRNALRITSDVYVDSSSNDLRVSADSPYFLVMGQRLFFRSKDELSTTDGTLAGTTVVRELVPDGTAPSDSRGFVELRGLSAFFANDGIAGDALWRTDGTAAGTRQVLDLKEGPADAVEALPANMQAVDGQLFFDADDGTHGRELWVSDGTPSGTHMVADAESGPAGLRFDSCATKLAFNGFVYFGARRPESPDSLLWRTDATPAGTTLFFRAANLDARSPACPLAVLGSTLYFAANDELWRTDGSAAGTIEVTDFPGRQPGDAWWPEPRMPVPFRGELTFTTPSAVVQGAPASSLWTVGTGSPRLVMDVAGLPAPHNSRIAWVRAHGDALYFAVTGGAQSGLYRWNGGTNAPERFEADITVPHDGWVVTFGSRFAFNGSRAADGGEMFASDGTAAGTVAVTDLSLPGENHIAGKPFTLGPALYFQFVERTGSPPQLGRTNGTAASFVKVTDFVADSLMTPATIAGQVILAATDVRDTVERELYAVRNERPLAAGDSATVGPGSSIAIDLAANDSDADGHVIAPAARIAAPPVHGSVMLDSRGFAIYQPNARFAGTDTFRYVAVDDGGRESQPATVTITVVDPSAFIPARRGGGADGWLLIAVLATLLSVQRATKCRGEIRSH